MRYFFILLLLLSACDNPFKKDNPKQETVTEPKQEILDRWDIYLEGAKSYLDSYGLVVMGHDAIGDSALFSCLARNAGVTDFNPEILFTPEGKPIRHPDISPKYSSTPISKDMVNGILWCLYDYSFENKSHALELVERMIKYGRANKDKDLWSFCTKEDIETYDIDDKRYYGRCVMTPAVSKDTYRLAMMLGWECDSDCKITMQTGTNLPSNNTGFRRHLAVLTTVRNGLIEGALNDNSLEIVLENAAKDVPRNALFHVAYHMFLDGNQSEAFKQANDKSLFPLNSVPTDQNYCTDYLYQRDETRDDDFMSNAEGCISYLDPISKEPVKECELDPNTEYTRYSYNKDWLPCPGKGGQGRGIEWLFAMALALNKVDGVSSVELLLNKSE